MKLDAAYDGDGRVSVPLDVYKELLKLYSQQGFNKELVSESKDGLEFIESIGDSL